MRKLLVLAFLLYDIIATATRTDGHDYDDTEASKIHYMQQLDDRHNWRKKSLLKPIDDREWERRRYEYDNQRYIDYLDSKSFNGLERQREMDMPEYRHRKYDDYSDKMPPPEIKNSEIALATSLVNKDVEKKMPLEMNCQRPHEKFDSCFAGCASVTCDNPRDRMQPCYPFCEAGCVCVHPYVRDDRTHKCILPEDCTKGLKGIPDLGEEAPSSS